MKNALSRVWLFPADCAELAFVTENPRHAELFAAEYNRIEADRPTGLIAVADTFQVIPPDLEAARL